MIKGQWQPIRPSKKTYPRPLNRPHNEFASPPAKGRARGVVAWGGLFSKSGRYRVLSGVGWCGACGCLARGAGEGNLAGRVRNPRPRGASARLDRRHYDRLWYVSHLKPGGFKTSPRGEGPGSGPVMNRKRTVRPVERELRR